jgi:uncharacterized membrane protein YgcG
LLVSTKNVNSDVNTYQIVAAGLAATGAAFVTSRFGAAGTLLGAAVTAMIITGGSAILKAYIENAAVRVRGGATRLRERREGRVAAVPPEHTIPKAQENPPGRPDLRNNLPGRMRAAVDWFRQLPTPRRRPILFKALVAAALAFAICMVTVWGVEKIIGNSLSCGIWQSCPYGAAPGIHVAGFDDSGAGSTLSGGDADGGGGGVDVGGGGVDVGGGGADVGGGGVMDSIRQGGVMDSIRQGGGVPEGRDLIPGGADPNVSPAPDGEEAPSSASPAAEPEPAPEVEPAPEESPSSASPAAEKQANPDASASPDAQ